MKLLTCICVVKIIEQSSTYYCNIHIGKWITDSISIFGLYRKKSAGGSVRIPLSETTVFEPQDEVKACKEP